jgi:hypothetical protein
MASVTMLTQILTRTPAMWLAGSMRRASSQSRPSASPPPNGWVNGVVVPGSLWRMLPAPNPD